MMTKEIKRLMATHQVEETTDGDGLLAPTESLKLIDVYRNGATGSIIIGTRCGSRVLTVMVPAASSREATVSNIKRVAANLTRLRCDGYLYIRRMRLHIDAKRMVEAVMIDQAGYNRSQRVETLSTPALYRTQDWNRRIGDEISTALEISFVRQTEREDAL